MCIIIIKVTFQEVSVIGTCSIRTRMMETQKYLKENCYHCIECSVANSLAALMRKWSLNSTFSALQPPPKTSGGG